jgi:hypothetical protein
MSSSGLPSDSPFIDEFNKLNNAIGKIKYKINAFKGSRKGFHTTIKEKITKINALINEINVNGVKQKQEELNILKKQQQEFERLNAELNSENSRLKQTIAQLNSTLQNLSSENLKLKSQIEILSSENLKLTSQIKTLLDQKAELERLLKDETLNKNAFAATNENLQVTIRDLGKQIQDCNYNLESLTGTNFLLNQTLQDLTQQKETLTKQQSNLESKLASLLENQTTNSNKLDESNAENNILKKQIDAGKRHIDEITNDILLFVSEINSLDTDDGKIGYEIERIMTQILELKKKLNDPSKASRMIRVPRENLFYSKEEDQIEIQKITNFDKLQKNIITENFFDPINDYIEYQTLFSNTRDSSAQNQKAAIINFLDNLKIPPPTDENTFKNIKSIWEKIFKEQKLIFDTAKSMEGGKIKRKTYKKNKRINKMRRRTNKKNKRSKELKGGWTYKGSPSLDSKSSVITDSNTRTNSKTRSKSKSSKSKTSSNRTNKKHKQKKVIRRSKR